MTISWAISALDDTTRLRAIGATVAGPILTGYGARRSELRRPCPQARICGAETPMKDQAEGVAAFLDERKPLFEGR
jgi:hypothetical protein